MKTAKCQDKMTSGIMQICIVFVLVCSLNFSASSALLVPALFVFGDSLVDVGNNNYLTFTLAKADFQYYGIDFPIHKPTGRFSNGKNAADFLAQKLGLPSPPPYLSLVHTKTGDFTKGVNFASAAAGILNTTSRYIYLPQIKGSVHDQLSHFTIPMAEQVENYVKVRGVLVQKLGQSGAAKHMAQSVFTIVIGSVDVGEYFNSLVPSFKEKLSPRQYIDLMIHTIKRQLKIYDNGARKFVMIGIGKIGCIPSERAKMMNEACFEGANYLASKYNQRLQVVLQEFESELEDFRYSYFNSYDFFHDITEIQSLTYGFKEVKAACCGLGRLNADVACFPFSNLCPNRSDHVYWDRYHPTEAAIRIVIDAAFDGAQQFSFPINIRQLVST